MNMSEEEKEYIIENIDELIRLARKAQFQRMEGPHEEADEANTALEKQRRKILSMDGIEDDY